MTSDLVNPLIDEETTPLIETKQFEPVHPPFSQSWNKAFWLLVLFGLGLGLSIFSLGDPAQVVFDEVHVGGAVERYLKGEYGYDVHPPLGKLILTLAAKLALSPEQLISIREESKSAWTKVGAPIGPLWLPALKAMRFTAGLFGIALLAPIFMICLTELGLEQEPWQAAALTIALVLFDNALITFNRFALLDPLLLFFLAASLACWLKANNEDQKSKMQHPTVDDQGDSWLFLAGCFFGCALSIKWSAIPLLLFFGVCMAADLWTRFCAKEPLLPLCKKLLKYVLNLIVIPALVYILFFRLHFALIEKCSEQALDLMSPEFRAAMPGFNPTSSQTYSTLVYGSRITLRQRRPDRTVGPFLHSHHHQWPNGSKQQQVTGYGFRDDNNLWIVRSMFGGEKPLMEGAPVLFGDAIRLQHFRTGRFLHTHLTHHPPISSKDNHFEVTAYGGPPAPGAPNGISDMNDNWVIERVDQNGRIIRSAKGQQVKAIEHLVRLTHPFAARCYLQTLGKQLPEFAFSQSEITCGKETLKANAMWQIESNEHISLEAKQEPLVSYKPLNFMGMFREVSLRMLRGTLGKKLPYGKDGKEASVHPFRSYPHEWPRLKGPLALWIEGYRRIVMIGNPLVWISAGLCLVFYALCMIMNKSSSLLNPERDSEAIEETDGSEISSGQSSQGSRSSKKLSRQGSAIPLQQPINDKKSSSLLDLFQQGIMAIFKPLIERINSLIQWFTIYLPSILKPLPESSEAKSMALWALFYLPLLALNGGRQLFLHHYLSAHVLGALPLLALVMSKFCGDRILIGFTLASSITFTLYSAFTYGIPMTTPQCERLSYFVPVMHLFCRGLPGAPRETPVL